MLRPGPFLPSGGGDGAGQGLHGEAEDRVAAEVVLPVGSNWILYEVFLPFPSFQQDDGLHSRVGLMVSIARRFSMRDLVEEFLAAKI